MPESPVDLALAHYEKNHAIYLDELKRLVRIPSVSFAGLPGDRGVAERRGGGGAAPRRGFENVQLLEVEGAHPYVFGERIKDPPRRRCCSTRTTTCSRRASAEAWKIAAVRAHRARRAALRPRRRRRQGGHRRPHRGGRRVAAGARRAAAQREDRDRGRGGDRLRAPRRVHRPHRSKLEADAIVLTDTGNFGPGCRRSPPRCAGWSSSTSRCARSSRAVHSGMWGGPVPDPVMALAKMLAGARRRGRARSRSRGSTTRSGRSRASSGEAIAALPVDGGGVPRSRRGSAPGCSSSAATPPAGR